MKLKRIQEIEAYVHENGSASIDELCDKFNVSKNTIRRDINKIVENGTIKKVYGGVASVSNQLKPYEHRHSSHSEEKIAIGKAAATEIEDNDLVFIDSGTTTSCIGDFFDPEKRVTIITNNLNIINKAAELSNYQLILIGMTYKRATRSFVNVESWEYFKRINITKSFMAATGLSIERGVTNSDLLEYDIKSRIVEKTDRNILLVDHSKFDKAALVTYSNVEKFHQIITSDSIPENYKVYCKEKGIKINYVNQNKSH
ncbi:MULTISPECIES: DeoR/GlpR family DNA-binding transcription regulator [Virgibacillus]|uniref:DeoR/GlpR family DNA-binding transcription regulator n=1 Tax=Virgibacillus dokdonensis TaxID=302167 RepID=A0ABU7VJD7_9BACI|nr:DeoR/GlpR family DNA-binding transcription regulator [Virgibacillus sp.]NWO12575.1 DeoR/GlpR transcriptional regulator [Virgibacillus sp.]